MQLLKRYSLLGEKFVPGEVVVRDALRVNTLKIKEEELVKRLEKKGVSLEKIGFARHGYYYNASFSLGATPEYLQGFYYLQDAASQLPVQVLNPGQGELVLDMAASPGGKTTQLAQWMSNEGVIVALDSNGARLDALANNLERLSVKNVLAYKKDSRFAFDLGLSFDKVLLDAPCSGNFCVEKDFFKKRSAEDFKDKARVQKELLKAAFKCLKPGGVLVYSTCSLEPEENELVVQWFLENFEVSLADTGLEVGDEGLTRVFGKELVGSLSLTKRFWPHKTGTEGFFIAKLIKNKD